MELEVNTKQTIDFFLVCLFCTSIGCKGHVNFSKTNQREQWSETTAIEVILFFSQISTKNISILKSPLEDLGNMKPQQKYSK